MPDHFLLPLCRALVAGAGLLHAGTAGAQAPAAATPAASSVVSPPPPEPPAPEPQRVEVTGARPTDTEQRRQSTAAKIVVGRDEIERFGDATLGELLKRLPGVTLGGTPGRGGQIRMRGLGGGYTQILLDGERVQGGLSLDAIDPEMIERIEIQRAPTAETGARAIAGTLNIITREGFRRRLNDLKLNAALEAGGIDPSLNWTREDRWDAMRYTLSLNAWRWQRPDQGRSTTEGPGYRVVEQDDSRSTRQGLNASARLRWEPGEGEQLMLSPLLVCSGGDSDGRSVAAFEGALPPGVIPYDSARRESDSRFMLARLNGQWRHRLGEGRLEWRGGAGASRSGSRSERERGLDDLPLTRTRERSDGAEQTLHLDGKYSLLLEQGHSLVGGMELEAGRREEDNRTDIEGEQPFSQHESLRAATRRLAAYAQDEWQLGPQWSAHAGLRWEGLDTESDGADTPGARHRSSVWTPLLHALWRPAPKSRDQVRVSLTRSYRSPTLGHLLGRYQVNSDLPTGSNTETRPDRAGNPGLRPELATGIDLALEHYLPRGGLFSANLFHRRIQDLMRTVVAREDVPGFDSPRWVARPRNIGSATTEGLELEARFRLDELVDDAPALDLRANLGVFRSRVDSVPGPDNRLDQQPGASVNLGLDYRWPGLPLSLGGNVNLTPGYTTRLAANQWIVQSRKRVVDAYALWTLRPDMRLRLSASNLLAEDVASENRTNAERTTSETTTFVNWRLSLELKL